METYKGHTIQRKEGDKWYYHYSPKEGLEGGFTGKAMSVKECRKSIDIHYKKPKHKTLHIAETLGHASTDKKPSRDRTRKRKIDV